jgi:hypothetical protein
MRPGLDMRVKQKDWGNAARSASNLSELELTLGEVSGALSDAERSVTYADRSGDADWSRNARVAHADALHQSGRVSEAESLFREAEQMQAESTPANPLLPGIAGFRYCDLLLAAPSAPRGGWFTRSREEDLSVLAPSRETLDALQEVSARATQTLKWAEQNNVALLDIALDHLTLSRAALYESLLSGSAISHSASPLSAQSSEIEAAVSGLRRAGQAVCDRPMKVDTGNRI